MSYVIAVHNFSLSSPFLPARLRLIGYMNKIFSSKQDAAKYYNHYNPKMPSLDLNKSYRSDLHTKSRKIYVVRKFFGQELSLPPFENKKLSIH